MSCLSWSFVLKRCCVRTLGNENSDAGHFRCSHGPQVPLPCLIPGVPVPLGVHLRLAIEGKNMFTCYLFRIIYTYISEYSFHKSLCLLVNIFLLFSSAFSSYEILGVHAQLSKCWRGAWPEKVWEPLLYTIELRIRTISNNSNTFGCLFSNTLDPKKRVRFASDQNSQCLLALVGLWPGITFPESFFLQLIWLVSVCKHIRGGTTCTKLCFFVIFLLVFSSFLSPLPA